MLRCQLAQLPVAMMQFVCADPGIADFVARLECQFWLNSGAHAIPFKQSFAPK
jgi:hypothetical protein